MASSAVVEPFSSLASCFGGSLKPVCLEAPPIKPFQSEAKEPARKRRKKEPSLSRADVENREHHAELVSWLAPAIDRAREAHLGIDGVKSWHGDCVEFAAKELDAAVSTSKPLFGQEEQEMGEKVIEVATTARLCAKELTEAALINVRGDIATITVEDSEVYFLPPRSAFVLARLDEWQVPLEALARHTKGIDLVVLDPPWPNASASRSDEYSTFDIYDLFRFDLPSVLKETSESKSPLIAVWITNKPKFRRFVLDKLFPAWDIKAAATNWYWVKITGGTLQEGGKPVWPLSNEHRRCYEGLLLGRYGAAKGIAKHLPMRYAFLSVPLGHSRKPPLLELLRPYLDDQENPTVLELFARTTLSTGGSGMWISAGDEAIKFNAQRYWTVQ